MSISEWNIEHKTIHGHASEEGTPEYHAWRSMKARCTNPNNASFKNYGGRGITVCERWLNNFQMFLNDMGVKPSPEYSLGRKDNDGQYDRDNCRWETPTEQANNRRSGFEVSYNGRRQTLAEWSRESGIKQTTLANRIKQGWAIERALTEPSRQQR